MLTVTICVGSSCSVRGSDELAAALEKMIITRGLSDQVELVGAFCMDQCSMGISMRVGDRQFRGLHPEDVATFFDEQIVPLVHGGVAPAGAATSRA